MKVGDLVHDTLTGLKGVVVESLGPEDMWLVFCEDGAVYECGDWEVDVINEDR